jgi:hypothetical protein
MLCRTQLTTRLLAVTLFAAGCAGPPDTAPAPAEPAVSSTDFDLIELVLVDLPGFAEFHTAMGRNGKRSQIVLNHKTIGSAGFISDDQLNGE